MNVTVGGVLSLIGAAVLIYVVFKVLGVIG